MRVVLANGTFDPLHFGHVLHLELARSYGDALIVALTGDEAVRREKGESRPLFRQEHRAHMLLSLKVVDGVVVVGSGIEGVRLVRPDVFVKGADYTGKLDLEILSYCKAEGIEIRLTDTPKWSGTKVGDALRSC